MTATILCFTKQGALLCNKVKGFFEQAEGYSRYEGEGLLPLKDNLKNVVHHAFLHSEAIIFIGAAGIAVRLIAPYITSKDKDPAVVVMDEKGNYVIPILSGHLGGANQIATRLADGLGGQAVITTATDCNQVFAVDLWAKEQGLFIHNISDIKYISSALLKGERIGFRCDYPLASELPEFIAEEAEAGIEITEAISRKPYQHTLTMTPKAYVLGIGCRRDTDVSLLEDTVISILKAADLELEYVKTVASIDLKAKEAALLKFCDKYRLPFLVYTGEELSLAKGEFTASAFVKSITGVDNVCERSASLASDNGNIILKKTSSQGITVAVAKMDWRCRF